MSPRTIEQNKKIREQKRRQIHKAALSVYIDFGFTGANMDLVAERAGLSKGIVYYYYKTKKQLFRALFDFMFAYGIDLNDKIMEKIARNNPVDQLVCYIWEMLNLVENSKYDIRFVMRLPFDAYTVFGPEKWKNGLEQANRFRNTLAGLLKKIIAEKKLALEPQWAGDTIWAVFVSNALTFSKMIFGERITETEKTTAIKISIFRDLIRFCLQGLGIASTEWSEYAQKVISENTGGEK